MSTKGGLQGVRAISAVPFSELLGNLLNAAVNSHIQAKMITLEWIKSVAFHPSNSPEGASEQWEMGDVRTVDFGINRPTGPGGMQTKAEAVRVPVLCFLSAPSFGVKQVTLEINVSLTYLSSAEQTDVSSTQNTKFESQNASTGVASATTTKFTSTDVIMSSIANQGTSRAGVNVKRKYSMALKLEMEAQTEPDGLQHVINLLMGAAAAVDES
mmetsp:Transcript_42228/g.106522  ORF Transcript_42228/g.106522 Transcript_42228/m.106522 type:complete len:213 (-) Transcript_42228:210-848(-)